MEQGGKKKDVGGNKRGGGMVSWYGTETNLSNHMNSTSMRVVGSRLVLRGLCGAQSRQALVLGIERLWLSLLLVTVPINIATCISEVIAVPHPADE